MNRIRFAGLIALALIATVPALRAEVKPNSLFSDGMVLQRGVSVPIWGTAKDGEKVTVKFQGQTVVTTARDGRWMVRLKRLKAGGPFTLSIAAAKSPLKAEWFNPHTGKRADAGSFSNGTASLTPPTDWGNVPLVLHLKAH